MSVTYHDLIANAALKTSALVGVQAADLETTYLTRPLTQANFKSAVFPFTAYKVAALHAEQRLATAIAASRENPLRVHIDGVTTAQANEAVLPSTDSLGRPVIGAWGDVVDASDGSPLDEWPLADIRLRARNANSFFKLPAYGYRIVAGRRINHTRTTVVVGCCVYDRSAQKAAVDANSAMLLPDSLEEGLVSAMLATLVRDGEFEAQAERYARHADRCEQALRAGAWELPPREE